VSDGFWSKCKGGVLITVRLTPKSARDEICGVEQLSDGKKVLKARVRAAPEKGGANAALLVLFARALGMSLSDVYLASGSTSRLKKLQINGDSAVLGELLAQLTRSIAELAAGQSEKRQNRQ
jgi:uncharacterized protein (TIGR00251 family)